MMATYFPKPLNALMGNWALSQAQARRRHGVDIMVASSLTWDRHARRMVDLSAAIERTPLVSK